VGIRNFVERIEIRAMIDSELERAVVVEGRVLRWLVSFAETDESLGLAEFNVADPAAELPVPDVSNRDSSDALENLTHRNLIHAEPFMSMRPEADSWYWVFPTAWGIDEVERPMHVIGAPCTSLHSPHVSFARGG
jgi:hypothetical protein